MKISKTLIDSAQAAKKASLILRLATTAQKNEAIHQIAHALKRMEKKILKANALDIEQARAHNLSEVLIDRLSLAEGRLEGVIKDAEAVAHLADPVGEIIEKTLLPNGLKLQKIRVPIGVLGILYEARPNVTVDCAVLALKTGNAAILRGGKETLKTNRVLIEAIHEGLKKAALPSDAIQFIKSPNRSQVKQLLKLDAYIDMIIPRGGEGLHRFCREESTIPVITGGMGICHLFVDESADIAKSLEVLFNAKTQRPTVCNALDTVLIHEKIAASFLPKLVERLSSKQVQFRLDEEAWNLLNLSGPSFKRAEPTDWKTEWMSLILGVKIVKNIHEAIAHIQTYSTAHSDGILTSNKEHADLFLQAIDSATVYVNASTRFTDGAQFGLGAEIAVSTQKLHARGPMGLKELTSYKWIIEGDYHTRV